MARGFAQQPDYKNIGNFMKGYIHRLITIGTPHFGGQLAGILYSHCEDWYCFERSTQIISFPTGCQFDVRQFQFLPLKAIFADKYSTN